jgi:hypothetical protein
MAIELLCMMIAGMAIAVAADLGLIYRAPAAQARIWHPRRCAQRRPIARPQRCAERLSTGAAARR